MSDLIMAMKILLERLDRIAQEDFIRMHEKPEAPLAILVAIEYLQKAMFISLSQGLEGRADE